MGNESPLCEFLRFFDTDINRYAVPKDKSSSAQYVYCCVLHVLDNPID